MTNDKKQMSHRRHRPALLEAPKPVPRFPNVQPRPLISPGGPQPHQVSIAGLVPALIASGAVPGADLGIRTDGMVTVVAHCGPIAIPLSWDIATAEQVRDGLSTCIDKAREALAAAAAAQPPADADGLPPVPDGCADLLAEAIAAVNPEPPAEAETVSPGGIIVVGS